jgi:hypothetical protein
MHSTVIYGIVIVHVIENIQYVCVIPFMTMKKCCKVPDRHTEGFGAPREKGYLEFVTTLLLYSPISMTSFFIFY